MFSLLLKDLISDFIFEKLENNLDSKIKKTVLSVMNPEITKLKTEFNYEVEKIRREVNSVAEKCLGKTENKSYAETVKTTEDLSLNIVISNLHESQSENVTEKANSPVRDGLKIYTSVASAERKKARNPDENGVGF